MPSRYPTRNQLALALALALTGPLAIAQNCFDGDFGIYLGTGQDTVFLMRPIGFPFSIAGVAYSNIHVADHGLAYLSNNNVPAAPLTNDPVLFTPTTANFMAGSPKVCCLYADIVCPTGRIYLNSSPTKCVVTWTRVQNFGFTVLFDMQMTLLPGGVVRFVYGPGATNNSTFGGSSDNGIVGVCPGGGVALPAASDLSAGGATANNTVFESWTLPATFDMAGNSLLLTRISPTSPTGWTYALLGAQANCAAVSNYGTGCASLELAPFGLPSLGNANFHLVVSNAYPFQAFVGFGDMVIPAPGIPLAPIGMAGCNGLTNLNLGLYYIAIVVGGVGSYVLPIPTTVGLVGIVLSSQGVSFTNTTALGVSSSNGTQITIGFGN